MNGRLASVFTAALATGLLATGLLATLLTGTADATTTAVGTSRTPQPSSTSTPSKDRGVVVQVSRDAPAAVSLARQFAPNTIFSVSLYENLSTGYSWSQSVPTAPTGPVTLLDTDYVQDPASPGMAGVGGTRFFRYLVASPGDTTITFLYRRPWETGIPPLKQVTLAVYAR